MADLPILFSAPMVRALIAGTKTQTRRLLTPQPAGHVWRYGWSKEDGATWNADGTPASGRIPIWAGDRLWVRESLTADRMENFLTGVRNTKATVAYYAADDAEVLEEKGFNVAWRWKRPSVPSIHMPRSLSRITLIVEDVKVERLQDITNEDCIAEGVPIHPNKNAPKTGPTRDAFARENGLISHYGAGYQQIWETINGKGSFSENPWVVAYTFRRIMGNIDRVGGA